MSFHDIPTIESADFYIDVAFRAATKAGDEARSNSHGTRLEKSKAIEMAKLLASKRALERQMLAIIAKYPSIDDLTEFYKMLIKNFLDYPELKKSLGAVQWVVKRLNALFEHYYNKMKKTRDLHTINALRREYYGRISSLVKQIKGNLKTLEHARRTMKTFPVIKSCHTTVCIAGFPNVGKTTLLKKLTTSKAEVNSYAFTTKTLNVGYNGTFQFIDTPGTLNRLEKMNIIEAQAYLSLKYCADVIVYVYDVTEPYPLEDQKKLLLRLQKVEKPILVYVSKHDLVKEQVEEFCRNKEYFTDAQVLFDVLKEKYAVQREEENEESETSINVEY